MLNRKSWTWRRRNFSPCFSRASATTPGQAITYQIGKLQILRLVADARLKQGEKFRLRQVHDFLFSNGYLPLSLIRWQYLGLRDEVDRLEKLR